MRGRNLAPAGSAMASSNQLLACVVLGARGPPGIRQVVRYALRAGIRSRSERGRIRSSSPASPPISKDRQVSRFVEGPGPRSCPARSTRRTGSGLRPRGVASDEVRTSGGIHQRLLEVGRWHRSRRARRPANGVGAPEDNLEGPPADHGAGKAMGRGDLDVRTGRAKGRESQARRGRRFRGVAHQRVRPPQGLRPPTSSRAEKADLAIRSGHGQPGQPVPRGAMRVSRLDAALGEIPNSSRSSRLVSVVLPYGEAVIERLKRSDASLDFTQVYIHLA